MGALLAGLPNTVGGVTVNRFCASGVTALAMAADRIRVGESDVMIAGGCESMSMVPMMGNKPSLSPHIFDRNEDVGIAYGMGLTAEKVAERWKISREAQDAFSVESHRKRDGRAAVRRVQRRNRRVHDQRALPRSRDRRSAREHARDPRSTKARAPTRRWKGWRSCVRCSRTRAR